MSFNYVCGSITQTQNFLCVAIHCQSVAQGLLYWWL